MSEYLHKPKVTLINTAFKLVKLMIMIQASEAYDYDMIQAYDYVQIFSKKQ